MCMVIIGCTIGCTCMSVIGDGVRSSWCIGCDTDCICIGAIGCSVECICMTIIGFSMGIMGVEAWGVG